MVWHEREAQDFELVNELAWGRYGPNYWPVLVWKEQNYVQSAGERSLASSLRSRRGRAVAVAWLGDSRQESLLSTTGELKVKRSRSQMPWFRPEIALLRRAGRRVCASATTSRAPKRSRMLARGRGDALNLLWTRATGWRP
eukprot:scaffold1220_cov259-Pinguiococcus_pyrenoidosus.AAC.86